MIGPFALVVFFAGIGMLLGEFVGLNTPGVLLAVLVIVASAVLVGRAIAHQRVNDEADDHREAL